MKLSSGGQINLLSGASICIGFLLYFSNNLGPGAECCCWGLDFDVGFRSLLLGSKSSLLKLCTIFVKGAFGSFIS